MECCEVCSIELPSQSLLEEITLLGHEGFASRSKLGASLRQNCHFKFGFMDHWLGPPKPAEKGNAPKNR
eukprot:1106438-Amphidinium_carterae.1